MIVITKFIKNWRSNDTECYNRTEWNVEYWLGRVFLYQAIRAQSLSLSRYLTSLVFRNKLQNRISNGRFWEYCVIASFQAPLNFFLLFNLYLTIYPAGHLVNFSNLNFQMDTQFQNTFQRKCPKKLWNWLKDVLERTSHGAEKKTNLLVKGLWSLVLTSELSENYECRDKLLFVKFQSVGEIRMQSSKKGIFK